LLKTKFHYAIQLASWSRAGRSPVFRPVTDRFELSGHVEIARTWSQLVSRAGPQTRPAREPGHEPYVMEFGLNQPDYSGQHTIDSLLSDETLRPCESETDCVQFVCACVIFPYKVIFLLIGAINSLCFPATLACLKASDIMLLFKLCMCVCVCVCVNYACGLHCSTSSYQCLKMQKQTQHMVQFYPGENGHGVNCIASFHCYYALIIFRSKRCPRDIISLLHLFLMGF